MFNQVNIVYIDVSIVIFRGFNELLIQNTLIYRTLNMYYMLYTYSVYVSNITWQLIFV